MALEGLEGGHGSFGDKDDVLEALAHRRRLFDNQDEWWLPSQRRPQSGESVPVVDDKPVDNPETGVDLDQSKVLKG